MTAFVIVLLLCWVYTIVSLVQKLRKRLKAKAHDQDDPMSYDLQNLTDKVCQ
jgi:hypothetical protein